MKRVVFSILLAVMLFGCMPVLAAPSGGSENVMKVASVENLDPFNIEPMSLEEFDALAKKKTTQVLRSLMKLSFPIALCVFILGIIIIMLSGRNPIWKQFGLSLAVGAPICFLIIQLAPIIYGLLFGFATQ